MTNHLIVLSDLHLAPPGPLNNFSAGNALAAFLGEITKPTTTLVLAGDTFDFLQIEGRPDTLDGPSMPALIKGAIDAIGQSPWGRDLYKNLGEILKAGGQCVVLPGNHDPEVAHPEFANHLLASIGLPQNHPGLIIHTEGPWRTRIGEREIIVGHGHRNDPWNDIDPANVTAALNGAQCPLPPGSRLVTEVLNPFKQALDPAGKMRFPFLDLLKPEMPAVPLLLLYLDHTLAMRHLPRALGLTLQALANALAKALEGGPTLGAKERSPTATPADDIARGLAPEFTLAERQNPARCADELEAWLNSEKILPLAGTLAAHAGIRPRMLRAFLRLASDNGKFFNRTHRSDDDRAITREYLQTDAPPRVVVAGHTHAAREVWLSDHHAYINTGTWTDLIQFPAQIDDAELRMWIDRLEKRDLPRVTSLTYADITPDTAKLCDYRGTASS